MTESNFLQLAKQGDANAIATLMNQKLQPKGISAKAVMKNDCLHIMLEAAKVPNQQTLVALIRKSMMNLGAECIRRVKVYGKQTGEEFPAWNEEFEVVAQTLPNFEELAKQGDVNAIATLISQWLNSQGVTAKASLKNDCLQVKLESAEVPDRQLAVPLIRDRLIGLDIQSFKKVKIFGLQTGDDFPDWQEEFQLEEQENLPAITPEIVVEVETSNSSIVTQPTSQLAAQKQSRWGSLFGAVAGAAGAVGGAAVTAGQAAAGAAIGVGGAISSATVLATENVGYAIDFVANSPLLQKVKNILPKEWLNIIDQVDLVKAEAEVRKLQQQYPNKQPRDIAHRLMMSKALKAGSSGFVTSLGSLATAAPFLVLDLTANMLLQSEMLYQIACAYGFDLQDPTRKDEVIAVFGLSFGGSQALKAAGTQATKIGSTYAAKAGVLGFLKTVPGAGAVISASANAAMIYALGYGGCRFYEAKTSRLSLEATLVDSQVESEKYLKSAIAQEVIMDQILVHVVLAGNSGKTWQEILPELQTLNLSPASMDAIAADIDSPPPLETLLEQINSDFAIPLLAQCEKIAQLDGVITPEETKVIQTITEKFNIDMATIQAAVS